MKTKILRFSLAIASIAALAATVFYQATDIFQTRNSALSPKAAGVMRFALCQYESRVGNMAWNIENALGFVKEAAENDADFIILPEFSFTSVHDVGSRSAAIMFTFQGEPKLKGRLSRLARRYRCFLLVNHPNRAPDGRLTNQSILFGPNGDITATYDKRELAEFDIKAGFQPGDRPGLFDLAFGRIGVAICKDSVRKGVKVEYGKLDLLIVQYAHILQWKALPDQDLKKEQILFDSNGFFQHLAFQWAQYSHAPALIVNKTGLEYEFAFCGGSMVTDARGVKARRAGSGSEILYADFRLDKKGKVASLVQTF